MNSPDGQKHSEAPVPPTTRKNVPAVVTTSTQADQARMSNEGGTEGQVGDTSGPGAGYDAEPVQVKDKGGVS
jgi:hypothetical protein